MRTVHGHSSGMASVTGGAIGTESIAVIAGMALEMRSLQPWLFASQRLVSLWLPNPWILQHDPATENTLVVPRRLQCNHLQFWVAWPCRKVPHQTGSTLAGSLLVFNQRGALSLPHYLVLAVEAWLVIRVEQP